MTSTFYYTILTVDAFELTRLSNRERLLKKTKKPSYFLDLSDPLVSDSSLVVTSDTQKTNALFDQILLETDDDFKALRHNLSELDLLIKSIIIVDFSELFKTLGGIDGADKMITEIQNVPAPFSTSDHLNRLLTPYYDGKFDKNDLIKIKYADGQICSFLPFDKSSSMSKNCKITFINSKLRDKLDKRLQMDFPFDKMELQLSKYYAYRGLYLTSGIRIHRNVECGFVLNEKTVLILPDLMLEPKGNFVSANGENDPLPLLFTSEKVPEPGERHTFSTVRKKPEKINAFDGEGLILPEFSQYINESLGDSESDCRKTSFQIRMPYVKGMLHEVDFQEFLSTGDADAKITDCFGIQRSVKDVRIILTASMFKCIKWLKKYAEDTKKDPVEVYFDRFYYYDHALYVCGTNASIPSSKSEVLSYQFLYTMALNSDEFDSLIEKHFDNSWGILYNTYRGNDFSNNKIIEAAKKNSGFYSDPLLVEQAVTSCRNMRSELALGHLRTEGGHYYLSADLLAFLFYLKDLLVSPENDSEKPSEENELSDRYRDLLLSESFYLPNTPLSLSSDMYYAVLRSPHLARSEEMLLKAYLPNAEDDLYKKYFGHLSGVLMLPAASFYPMIIQSADFDGDICKIYTDESITSAVKRGVYTKKFQRRLPVTIIPSEDSLIAVPDNQEFVKLIINTFSNCTGLISNIAVQFAENEYNENSKEPCEEHYCDLCGPIVCLEIDSCKHGRHPIEDIKYLQEIASGKGKKSRNFIELKNLIKKYRYPYEIKESKGIYSLSFHKGQSPLKVGGYDASSHNLLRLPCEFAGKSYQATDDTDTLIQHGILSNDPCGETRFIFEDPNEKYGVLGLSDVGIEESLKLKDAYEKFTRDMKKYRYERDSVRNMPEFAVLYTLLGAKYDSINGKLPINGRKRSERTVSETLEDLLTLLRQPTTLTVTDKIFRDWMFSKKEERLAFLSNRLHLDISCLTPEIEALVCDFSCNGFLILGIANSIAKKQRAALNAIANFTKHKKNENDYYQALWEHFFLKSCMQNQRMLPDSDCNEEDYDEDCDFQFSETFSSQNLINHKCYEMLLKIAKDNNIGYDEDINITAVKYAWAVTYGMNSQKTSFFWDILPMNDILSQVREGTFDA